GRDVVRNGGQLVRGNGGDHAGREKKKYELAFQWRQHIAQRLRKDDVAECLIAREAQRLRRFQLPTGDAFYACTDNLDGIGTAVENHCDDGRLVWIKADADRRHAKVNDVDLDQERRIADDFNVSGYERAERLR